MHTMNIIEKLKKINNVMDTKIPLPPELQQMWEFSKELSAPCQVKYPVREETVTLPLYDITTMTVQPEIFVIDNAITLEIEPGIVMVTISLRFNTVQTIEFWFTDEGINVKNYIKWMAIKSLICTKEVRK